MPKVSEGTYIETVYGDMVDPTTAEHYDQRGTKLTKPSAWIDAQVAAGKMKADGYKAEVAAPAEALKPVKSTKDLEPAKMSDDSQKKDQK